MLWLCLVSAGPSDECLAGIMRIETMTRLTLATLASLHLHSNLHLPGLLLGVSLVQLDISAD